MGYFLEDEEKRANATYIQGGEEKKENGEEEEEE